MNEKELLSRADEFEMKGWRVFRLKEWKARPELVTSVWVQKGNGARILLGRYKEWIDFQAFMS